MPNQIMAARQGPTRPGAPQKSSWFPFAIIFSVCFFTFILNWLFAYWLLSSALKIFELASGFFGAARQWKLIFNRDVIAAAAAVQPAWMSLEVHAWNCLAFANIGDLSDLYSCGGLPISSVFFYCLECLRLIKTIISKWNTKLTPDFGFHNRQLIQVEHACVSTLPNISLRRHWSSLGRDCSSTIFYWVWKI